MDIMGQSGASWDTEKIKREETDKRAAKTERDLRRDIRERSV